jgi:hypothetical protein
VKPLDLPIAGAHLFTLVPHEDPRGSLTQVYRQE